MDDYESLSHSKWECKYHVVFIPKCRRKGRRFTWNCVGISVSCSADWLRRRNAGLKKGI